MGSLRLYVPLRVRAAGECDRRCVAVIGAGCWGKRLVRTFAELGALRAVCDSDSARLAAMPNGTVKHYGRTEDCLADPEISAVAISTPAVSHFDMVWSALDAGKDVFVEKPLALSLRDGHELVRFAADSNRILMIGNILRYHPAVCRLKEMTDAGELGKLEYIYSSRLSIDRLRAEENILWSFAPHEVSVILSLLGEMPIAVSCQGGDYVSRGVSDVTVSKLVFAGGVRAQAFVGWLHPYRAHRLVVVGSEKMAVFDDAAPDRLVAFARKDWEDSLPTASATGETVGIDASDPMRVECLEFLESLDTRRSPLTNGVEELRALAVLDACVGSLSHDGMRVEIGPSAPGRSRHAMPVQFRAENIQPASKGRAGAPA